MSILIMGVDMPTSCGDCKLRMAIGCCGNLPHNTRMPNCPLVEIPPHGDLIDRDALMQHEVLLPMDGGHLPIVYASYVRNAPTIIPAEETLKEATNDQNNS